MMSINKLSSSVLERIMHEAERMLISSPLGRLLLDKNITDITYNGESLFYLSSIEGRCYYALYHKNDALNLIRQIANVTNQLFTYQNPVLDVVFSHFRLSAVHPLIGRDREENAVSFAIRIANVNPTLLVDNQTITPEIEAILSRIIRTNKSIVISGQTGVGKTELQKYMIGLLDPHTRLVIIDQGIELALSKTLYPQLDITLWRYDERTVESQMTNLIRTSLRFNPDYIIIAEARGREIIDIYSATLSGHPSIFTMHSESEKQLYERMLAMTAYQVPLSENDFASVFPYVIHLDKKKVAGKIKRRIKTISHFEQESGKIVYIYSDET